MAGHLRARHEIRPEPTPEIKAVTPEDLAAALGEGIADFTRAPGYAGLFAGICVIGGWLVWYALASRGETWGAWVATVGFPILGPFVACGYYEISRRFDRAQPIAARDVLGAVFRQRNGQLPALCALVVMAFLTWNLFAEAIFALSPGLSAFPVFSTSQGTAAVVLLAVTGALLMALLFSLTVVGLPMLLDRDVDFLTAMGASVTLVRRSPAVMLGWGAFIAIAVLVSMLPGFLGLFLTLPVFGHSSWHLYRRVVAWEDPA